MKIGALIAAITGFLFLVFGIDRSQNDCIARAARTAQTDSGFRALAYMCQERFPDKPTLKPFTGELDRK